MYYARDEMLKKQLNARDNMWKNEQISRDEKKMCGKT